MDTIKRSPYDVSLSSNATPEDIDKHNKELEELTANWTPITSIAQAQSLFASDPDLEVLDDGRVVIRETSEHYNPIPSV